MPNSVYNIILWPEFVQIAIFDYILNFVAYSIIEIWVWHMIMKLLLTVFKTLNFIGSCEKKWKNCKKVFIFVKNVL